MQLYMYILFVDKICIHSCISCICRMHQLLQVCWVLARDFASNLFVCEKPTSPQVGPCLQFWIWRLGCPIWCVRISKFLTCCWVCWWYCTDMAHHTERQYLKFPCREKTTPRFYLLLPCYPQVVILSYIPSLLKSQRPSVTTILVPPARAHNRLWCGIHLGIYRDTILFFHKHEHKTLWS